MKFLRNSLVMLLIFNINACDNNIINSKVVKKEVFKQGLIKSTNTQTDLSIDGEGYFILKDPKTNKKYYTRNGKFKIDNKNRLISEEGYLLFEEDYNKVFSYVDIRGNIWSKEEFDGKDSFVMISNLKLAFFRNPSKLKAVDGNSNTFEESEESKKEYESQPDTLDLGIIVGASLEDISKKYENIPSSNCYKEVSFYKKTNEKIDLTINGEGFFYLLNKFTGQRIYTRNGNFKLDQQNRMVSKHGFLLQPQITINGKLDHIDETGNVWVFDNEEDSSEKDTNKLLIAGKINLAKFEEPQNLKNWKHTLPSIYIETLGAGEPQLSQPGNNDTGFLKSGIFAECEKKDILANNGNLEFIF